MSRPRIAVFSGPTATISNTPPLVTSNAARRRHGLPVREQRFDLLRPQRLAAPVTVYVEAYSAHPLEADAAALSAAPDGWLDAAGQLRPAPPGTPVHVVELRPEDGLYPLPYMGRQADGSAWDDATAHPFAPDELSRQTFFPDASRMYEELDRLAVGVDGHPVRLGTVADFEFFRPLPSSGYRTGTPPERLGEDYFPYYPYHLQREPTLAGLARATSLVQEVLGTERFAGAQWLDGSPNVEDALYWLGLLVDTTVPLVGHAAQRPHGAIGSDGGYAIVDGVRYLTSGIALDADGRDRVGPVVIVDELAFAAREVTKTDARPGGFAVTGGRGGVVAALGGFEAPRLGYLTTRRHTHRSDVRLTALPKTVPGLRGEVTVRDPGGLVPDAMPLVTITKFARFAEVATGPAGPVDPDVAVEIMARVEANLRSAPLAGFVAEGMSPYGSMDPTADAALAVAAFSGMPVVRVGRGNTAGSAYRMQPIFVAGDNLTATKARLLLMAALLRFGAWPAAQDPRRPTEAETGATIAAAQRFQDVFDTH